MRFKVVFQFKKQLVGTEFLVQPYVTDFKAQRPEIKALSTYNDFLAIKKISFAIGLFFKTGYVWA